MKHYNRIKNALKLNLELVDDLNIMNLTILKPQPLIM